MDKKYRDHGEIGDDVYMQVWQAEQSYASTRWNVTAFFLGISFATFGFSFQSNLTPLASLIVRVCGFFIYCFAYVMYLHYSEHANALRVYLLNMETSGQTVLDVQSKVGRGRMGRDMKRRSTSTLLLGFGVFYIVGIVLLWVFRL